MSWTRIFRRKRWDEERARELEAYIQIETDENIARGMSPEAARYAAHRKLGNLTLIREEIYRMNSLGWLETFWQDVHYGLRMLAKTPGFTAVAVLTLALGIGANTAIFSMVNSVLLRPLAYREAQQLYLVREIIPELSQTYPSLPANLPNFRVWQRECHSFEEVAIVGGSAMTLTGYGEAEQISGAMASSNLFHVLGIEPELGRTFLPEEDTPGKDHVVILTHSFWRARFQADPGIVAGCSPSTESPSKWWAFCRPPSGFPRALNSAT